MEEALNLLFDRLLMMMIKLIMTQLIEGMNIRQSTLCERTDTKCSRRNCSYLKIRALVCQEISSVGMRSTQKLEVSTSGNFV